MTCSQTHSTPLPTIILLAFLSADGHAAPARAAPATAAPAETDTQTRVFLCTNTDVPTFTDLDCHHSPYRFNTPDPVPFTPLSEDERTQLKTLTRKQVEMESRRAQTRKRAGRVQRDASAAAARRCADARSALAKLSDQRRKGYTAAQAQTLAVREGELKDIIRETC